MHPARLHQRLTPRRLVGLPRGESHDQGRAPTVGDQVQLAAEAAAGTARRVIGRFLGSF